MSNALFPTLAGLTWDIGRDPEWATQVSDSASGRQYTLGKRIYPIWHFELSFEVLRSSGTFTEWQTLLGFFNARNGRYDSFLYLDPRDNAVTAQAFGVGDGSTKSFVLVRSLGSFAEPVGGVNTAGTTIYVNGTPTTVTYDADLCTATFATAPAAAAVLTWTGQFYFRCRFVNDRLSLKQFMQDMYNAKSVKFRTYRNV